MPGLDYRAARGAISLEQVLALLGFVMTERCGAQVRGRCPLHASPSIRSRSFSAHLERNAYRCFVCGAWGNQLDLWAMASGQPLHAATVELCERLSVPVPWLSGGARGE
jgi:DNA primase